MREHFAWFWALPTEPESQEERSRSLRRVVAETTPENVVAAVAPTRIHQPEPAVAPVPAETTGAAAASSTDVPARRVQFAEQVAVEVEIPRREPAGSSTGREVEPLPGQAASSSLRDALRANPPELGAQRPAKIQLVKIWVLGLATAVSSKNTKNTYSPAIINPPTHQHVTACTYECALARMACPGTTCSSTPTTTGWSCHGTFWCAPSRT